MGEEALIFFFHVFLLSILSFLLMRFFPGSAISDLELVSDQVRQALQVQLNLSGSIWVQWWDWVRAGFGWTMPSLVWPGRSVGDVFLLAARNTFSLATVCLFFVFVLGLSFGYLASLRPASRRVADAVFRVFQSIPSLLLAPFLVWINFRFFDSDLGETFFLAVFAASSRSIFSMARLWSLEFSNLSKLGWVHAFQAWGLSRTWFFRKAVFLQVLSVPLGYFHLLSIQLLSGSFIVEVMFNRPGLGLRMFQALTERDSFFLSTFLFLIGLISLLLRWLSQSIHAWLGGPQHNLRHRFEDVWE